MKKLIVMVMVITFLFTGSLFAADQYFDDLDAKKNAVKKRISIIWLLQEGLIEETSDGYELNEEANSLIDSLKEQGLINEKVLIKAHICGL